MKKILMKTLMIVAMSLCMMTFSCATNTDGNNGGGTEKISSLQTVIDNAKDGDTIDLSKYEIANCGATINKAVTISGNSADMKNASLTVEASGVNISGVKNVSVTASSKIGSGDLKISSSSLSNLYVFGGGENSIHIAGSTVETVAASKENVRIALEGKTTLKKFLANKPCKIEGDAETANVGQLMLGSEAGSVTLDGKFKVETLFVQNADTSKVTLNSSNITIAQAGAAAGEIKIECSEGVTAPKPEKIDENDLKELAKELQTVAEEMPVLTKLTVRLVAIPDDGSVGAVAIFCNLNDGDTSVINGNSKYIASPLIDGHKAEWTFDNYDLNTPFWFQFVPMPSADTELGDDWWSYAISGSSSYGNDKNNMKCDFAGNNLQGQETVIIEVSPVSYLGKSPDENNGHPLWSSSDSNVSEFFPIYGKNHHRLFNENYQSCFTVNGVTGKYEPVEPEFPEYTEEEVANDPLYLAGANGAHWGLTDGDDMLLMTKNDQGIYTVTFSAESENPTPYGCKMTKRSWAVEYVLESSLPGKDGYTQDDNKVYAESGERFKFAFATHSYLKFSKDDNGNALINDENTKLFIKDSVETGSSVTFSYDPETHMGWYTYGSDGEGGSTSGGSSDVLASYVYTNSDAYNDSSDFYCSKCYWFFYNDQTFEMKSDGKYKDSAFSNRTMYSGIYTGNPAADGTVDFIIKETLNALIASEFGDEEETFCLVSAEDLIEKYGDNGLGESDFQGSVTISENTKKLKGKAAYGDTEVVYTREDNIGKDVYVAGFNNKWAALNDSGEAYRMEETSDGVYTVTLKAETNNPTPYGIRFCTSKGWLDLYALATYKTNGKTENITYAESGVEYDFVRVTEAELTELDVGGEPFYCDNNTKIYMKYFVAEGSEVTITFNTNTMKAKIEYTATEPKQEVTAVLVDGLTPGLNTSNGNFDFVLDEDKSTPDSGIYVFSADVTFDVDNEAWNKDDDTKNNSKKGIMEFGITEANGTWV